MVFRCEIYGGVWTQIGNDKRENQFFTEEKQMFQHRLDESNKKKQHQTALKCQITHTQQRLYDVFACESE